jgi:DNA adenine methylase
MDFSKFPNLKNVVYNDFNQLNVNLFKAVQNPKELLKTMNEIPVQTLGESETPEEYKIKFKEFQSEIFKSDFKLDKVDYETAAKYVYVITQVFSGSKPETSSFIDLKGKYKSKYLSFKDKLSKPKWIDHFLKISNVTQMDFQDVIEKYDSKTTYIYLDPPYWKTENYYSNHDFDRDDHDRLAKILNNVKSKFSLSYYDFDLLEEWYPKTKFRWESKEFTKQAAAKKGVKQNTSQEILILNY